MIVMRRQRLLFFVKERHFTVANGGGGEWSDGVGMRFAKAGNRRQRAVGSF